MNNKFFLIKLSHLVSQAEMVADGKKNSCALEGCSGRAVMIIGDCKFCSGKFCSKHRTVESHSCPNIEQCRQQHFEKNSLKLSNEKTVASKVESVK